MHPARSVIFFTTMSGAGYGMLFILLIGQLANMLPNDPVLGFIAFGLAFGLITAGLLSSTFHLGRPERAWRALTQWRSSWLSREGVMAIFTYMPTGLFAIWWCFGFLGDEARSPFTMLVGFVGAFASLVTVYCTAQIYASLRTIPAWFNAWVPLCYMVFSLMSGLVLLAVVMHLLGIPDQRIDIFAGIFCLIGLFIKRGYWDHIDKHKGDSSVESATGLGKFGTVSQLDAPHSQSNYLLNEMGFKIARKHSKTLRKIAFWAGFAVPMLLLLIVTVFLGQGVLGSLAVVFAGLSMAGGLYAERYLFFAEAKHAVTYFYGQK